MYLPEVESSSPHSSKKSSWAIQIVSWLGRICSFCSLTLMILANKVKLITSAFFNQSANPTSVDHSPTPLDSKFTLTPQKNFKNEEDFIDATHKKDPEVHKEDSDVDLSLSQLFEDEVEDEKKVDSNVDYGQEDKEGIKEGEQLKDSPSKFTKFRRFRSKKDQQQATIESLKTVSSPVVNSSPKDSTTVDSISEDVIQAPKKSATPELNPIYYDNKGKGNCQLLAILKGLELQYPNLLKNLRKSQNDDLTAQQLRQMGVDFARTQIDSCGKYAESVLSYVDTDRKEFNLVSIKPMEEKFSKDIEKIENDFKAKKINSKTREKQIQTCKAKRKEYTQNLKTQNRLILGNECDALFLNSLEKNGFYCSTLHLFTLSILLEIPIYVKEQFGVKDHDIQMFNPTGSEAEPIHLYRVSNQHYQYIFYTKD